MSSKDKSSSMNKVYETITRIISILAGIATAIFSDVHENTFIQEILLRIVLGVCGAVTVSFSLVLLYKITILFIGLFKRKHQDDECDTKEVVFEDNSNSETKEKAGRALSVIIFIISAAFFSMLFISLLSKFRPYFSEGKVAVFNISFLFDDISTFSTCLIAICIISASLAGIPVLIFKKRTYDNKSKQPSILKYLLISVLALTISIGSLFIYTNHCNVITERGLIEYRLISKTFYSWNKLDYYTYTPSPSSPSPHYQIYFKDGTRKVIKSWEYYDYFGGNFQKTDEIDAFIDDIFKKKLAHLRIEAEED